MFGKKEKQDKLLAGLGQEFQKIAIANSLALGDMPQVDSFREKLKNFRLDDFAKLNQKLIANIDEVRNEKRKS